MTLDKILEIMADTGIEAWINGNPAERRLRLLKTALLPLIMKKDEINRAEDYSQLLQALQHKYPERNEPAVSASTLIRSALRTIGCPQVLLGEFSYAATNDEHIIQFELMLALISVLRRLPYDKYNRFRVRATGRFLSHQPVIDDVLHHDFIESLYDVEAINPNNVSVFLGYLDELGCQNFKQPLLDFVHRNNFNITRKLIVMNTVIIYYTVFFIEGQRDYKVKKKCE